jgi:hypothetical protein
MQRPNVIYTKEHELFLYHEKVQRNPPVHSGVYEMKGHADSFSSQKSSYQSRVSTP